MLPEDILLSDLFDEFYLIPDTANFQPVKRKEIIEEINDELKFTGTNNRKTFWVYNDKDQFSGDAKVMLESLVVKGLGWSLEDITWFSLADNSPVTFTRLKDFFSPEYVIFWGCDEFLKENRIPQKWHEVLKGKEMKVLTVHPVSDYVNKPELKKALWESIQQLFELK
jgi:hypothetical protein